MTNYTQIHEPLQIADTTIKTKKLVQNYFLKNNVLLVLLHQLHQPQDKFKWPTRDSLNII